MAQQGSRGLFQVAGLLMNKSAIFYPKTGAPTNGTSGTLAGKAGKGSLYIDTTAGNWYINTGTKSSPTWTLFSPSGSQYTTTPITASGAIAQHTPATYVITKAGVAGMTLAAPTTGTDDGVVITVTSSTAFAHTITATGLLQTGSALTDVATFNAQAGATLELMAYGAKWIVMYANGVSFS